MRVAIIATKQIDQCFIRKTVDLPLPRSRRDLVWVTAVIDDEAVADSKTAGRGHEPSADIAESVQIVARFDRRRERNPVFRHQIALTRRMYAQHQYERDFLCAIERYIITSFDFHVSAPTDTRA